ncbi:MAG: hypothetical protein WCD44_01505 [Candidatus Babeliales bacterium]
MEYFHKISVLLSLIIILNYGSTSLSYTYYITNLTGQDVKVRLYSVFGSLNRRDELIEEYNTQKFYWEFPSSKAGLCLLSIKVSTKIEDHWVARNAPFRIISDDQLKQVRLSGDIISTFILTGYDLWELTRCGNRDFILVTDPESGKILALTS